MNPLHRIRPFFRPGSAEWDDGWYRGFAVGFVVAVVGMTVGFIW